MPSKPDLNTMTQTRTKSTRLKQSNAAKLYWSDPVKKAARIARMLANRPPSTGHHKPHTEATKAKLREINLKRWEGVERTRKRGKKEKPGHPMLILKGGVWVSNKNKCEMGLDIGEKKLD